MVSRRIDISLLLLHSHRSYSKVYKSHLIHCVIMCKLCGQQIGLNSTVGRKTRSSTVMLYFDRTSVMCWEITVQAVELMFILCGNNQIVCIISAGCSSVSPPDDEKIQCQQSAQDRAGREENFKVTFICCRCRAVWRNKLPLRLQHFQQRHEGK